MDCLAPLPIRLKKRKKTLLKEYTPFRQAEWRFPLFLGMDSCIVFRQTASMDAKINRTNPATKAPRIRGAFYLLLSLAACAIPFALQQRNTLANTTHVPATSSESRAGTSPLAMPKF